MNPPKPAVNPEAFPLRKEATAIPSILNRSAPMEEDLFLLDSPQEEHALTNPRNLEFNPGLSLRDRLWRALGQMREAYRGCDALIQVWLPADSGDGFVLTTSGEPFALDPDCERLINYRVVSSYFKFSAEENSKTMPLGLPGRVFLGKQPEWSPDVRFFSDQEYPRVGYARQCDVRGSLGVPIFNAGGQACLGVIEVVMTTERINYRSDYDQICGALQEMDLSSSQKMSFPRGMVKKNLAGEIASALRMSCEVNGFALAQAWVPLESCHCEGMKEEPCCVSTDESLFWVKDKTLSGFHEACSEHRLLRGQGIVGKALVTNRPWFCADIAAMSKIEYPLAHHARMFGLGAASAVCLRRGVDHGKAEIVLEFIFPRDCRRSEEQTAMVNALLVSLRQVCTNWKLLAEKESEDETLLPLNANVEESQLAEMGRARGLTKAEKTIGLEDLREYFSGSLKDAAKGLGVCPTTLKRICRQHGISRWPGRKIRKVGSSLRKLQVVINSVKGIDGAVQFSSLCEEVPVPMESLLLEEEMGKSVVTSLYWSGDPELQNSIEAPFFNDGDLSSSKMTSLQNKYGRGLPRVKAIYGEEKIRFRLKPNWGVYDLKQEVSNRFNIRNMNSIDLKYLAENSEWVLLRCDEDLRECAELFRTCRVHTIKVSVHPAVPPGSTSFG